MSIYRHGKKWRYEFYKHGIRHRKSGFKTKSEAIEAEARARTTLKKTSSDFMKLCSTRLEELKLKRTEKHFNENHTLIKNLIQRWNGKKQITRDDVEDYLNEIAGDSKQKANKHLRLIKALFNAGISREWFDYNPANRIKPYPTTSGRRYVPPIKDIKKVLNLANGLDKLYLLTVIYTLARISEINRLKWNDVNLQESWIGLWTRKAKNSNFTERRIPIGRGLKEVLRKLPKGEYVFTNPKTNKPYVDRKKLLKGLCKRAKVKPFGYHALRHYGASRLMSEGVALTDIQKVLGHSRATTTDIYLRSINPNLAEAMDKLEV